MQLDTGRPWDVEDWQAEIFADVFAGYQEVLAVLATGSGKTTMFGGFGVYHMQYTPGATVPVGAAAKPQAALLQKAAGGFVRRSKWLSRRFKVQDGFKRIIGMPGTPYEGRELLVYSAKDDTGDGVIPTLALIDELHRHKGSDLYGTWREKLSKRQWYIGGRLIEAQMITLSTAGDREDNPLEEIRDAARKLTNLTTDGRHTVARSKGQEFVMHDWSLRPGDNPHDLKLVKMVNPAANVTMEKLRRRHDSPTTKLHQWLRFTCNVMAQGEDSAIEPDVFDALAREGLVIPPDVPTMLGLDLGWKIDHAAIAPLGWRSVWERLVAGVVTLAPPVNEETVVAALLRFCEVLDVYGIVYDPNAGGEQMVQQLDKGTHPLLTDDQLRRAHGLPALNRTKVRDLVFIEHSQDSAPMALASRRLDEALSNAWIEHDGGRECATEGCRCGGFRGHVINAVQHTLGGEQWKYDRPADAKGDRRRKYPIDGLTALEFAHDHAVAEWGEGATPFDAEDYRVEAV